MVKEAQLGGYSCLERDFLEPSIRKSTASMHSLVFQQVFRHSPALDNNSNTESKIQGGGLQGSTLIWDPHDEGFGAGVFILITEKSHAGVLRIDGGNTTKVL